MILYILILLLIYFVLQAALYRSAIDAVAGIVTVVLILIQQDIFK